jgi:hypothetical protein
MRGRVPIETIVTQDFQREFLLRSGVEENAFRGTLDPSFVSSMLNAITTQNLDLPEGDPAFKPTSGTYGTVHVSELMKLHRPLQAGEVLTITTRGQREEPHPKGSMVTTNYRVTDAANEIVLEMERKTLTLTAPEDTAAPGVAELQAPKHLDAREGTTFVSSRTMTPDMVAGYCWFVTNRIHNEVDHSKHTVQAQISEHVGDASNEISVLVHVGVVPAPGDGGTVDLSSKRCTPVTL